MKPSFFLLAALLGAAVAPSATADVRLVLRNGDSLSGVVLVTTQDYLLLEHPLLGEVRIPREALADDGEAPSAGGEALAADGEALAASGEAAESGPATEIVTPPAWTGSVAGGLEGDRGNTEQLDARASFDARLESDETITDLVVAWSYSTKDDQATDDKSLMEARYQWLIPGSPWRSFIQGSAERDRFKDFDERLAISSGAAYAWASDEARTLVGRFGLGLKTETGTDDDTVEPEGVLGLQYERALNERQKLTASLELFPNLRDYGEYRFLGRSAWDISISDTEPWSLRLGLDMDFDSETDEARSTDYRYYLSLAYGF